MWSWVEGSVYKLMSLKIENFNGSSSLAEVSSHKFSLSGHKISIFHSKIFFLWWGGGNIMSKYNVFKNMYNIWKSRVHSQDGAYRSNSGQSGNWTGFSRSTLALPQQLSFYRCQLFMFIHQRYVVRIVTAVKQPSTKEVCVCVCVCACVRWIVGTFITTELPQSTKYASGPQITPHNYYPCGPQIINVVFKPRFVVWPLFAIVFASFCRLPCW